MQFEDRTLPCRNCSQVFVFSAGEQQFFAEKGLSNEPRRCPNCRLLIRIQRKGEDASRTAEVDCHGCGVPTRVPFQPKGYRPVYCSYCFQTKKREQQAQEQDQTEPQDTPHATNLG